MPDLDPDLVALSAALGGLSPVRPALNRDCLLYEAGRRAGSVRDRRVWPVAAGLFAVLSASLGMRLATAPVPPVQIQVVYVSQPAPEKAPVADPPSSPSDPRLDVLTAAPRPAGYLQLRDQVVRFGADSLPSVTPARMVPAPSVEQMLGLPAGTLDDGQKSRWQRQLSRGDV